MCSKRTSFCINIEQFDFIYGYLETYHTVHHKRTQTHYIKMPTEKSEVLDMGASSTNKFNCK
jgi:hypothetical protein